MAAHTTKEMRQVHVIDLNRGVHCKKRMSGRVRLANGEIAYKDKDGQPTVEAGLQMEVCMYVDEPGVYFDLNGRKVPEAIAASQGWNVKRYAKLREKTAERKAVMAEMAEVVAERMHEILDEAGGYKLVQISSAHFQVEDDAGVQIMPDPASEEVAREYFNLIVNTEVEAPSAPVMTFTRSKVDAGDSGIGGDVQPERE